MMEAEDFYSVFRAIACMTIFAFALSALARHRRKNFENKSLSWLSSLESRASYGRWLLIFVGLSCIIAMRFGPLAQLHSRWNITITIIAVGVTGGIASMLRELSDYAKLEIEVRKRLSPSKPAAVNKMKNL